MKKKILTLTLCLTMIACLAACGKQADEPKEVASQSNSKEDKIETVVEEEPAEEQVELTADTIDKYFGFEYADVADASETGFELTFEESYGIATVTAPSVPVRYSDAAPSTTDLAADIQAWIGETVDQNNLSVDDRMPVFNPFSVLTVTMGLGDGGWDETQTFTSARHTNPGDMQTASDALAWVEVDPTASWSDHNYGFASNYYAVMLPNDVFNLIDTETRGLKLVVSNPTDNFAIVDNCDIVGLDMPFANDFASVKVAGDIEAESTIEDVVAKHAPTSGTIDEANGNIILTWKTADGTVMDITFAADTYKALSVRIIAFDITDEIIEQLQ